MTAQSYQPEELGQASRWHAAAVREHHRAFAGCVSRGVASLQPERTFERSYCAFSSSATRSPAARTLLCGPEPMVDMILAHLQWLSLVRRHPLLCAGRSSRAKSLHSADGASRFLLVVDVRASGAG